MFCDASLQRYDALEVPRTTVERGIRLIEAPDKYGLRSLKHPNQILELRLIRALVQRPAVVRAERNLKGAVDLETTFCTYYL